MSDGRKNNGGNKNAGRKPKIEEIALIEKLGPLEESAFIALKNGIEGGEFPFVKLFFDYRFGKPKETKDFTTNGKDIISNIVISDEAAKKLSDSIEDEC